MANVSHKEIDAGEWAAIDNRTHVMQTTGHEIHKVGHMWWVIGPHMGQAGQFKRTLRLAKMYVRRINRKHRCPSCGR